MWLGGTITIVICIVQACGGQAMPTMSEYEIENGVLEGWPIYGVEYNSLSADNGDPVGQWAANHARRYYEGEQAEQFRAAISQRMENNDARSELGRVRDLRMSDWGTTLTTASTAVESEAESVGSGSSNHSWQVPSDSSHSSWQMVQDPPPQSESTKWHVEANTRR